MLLIHHVVILFALIIGSITDLKTREVPDWLTYALITTGLGLGIIETIFAHSLQPLIGSVIGLVVGIIIGYVMFYAGQWGGGDSKLIMGLGALIGLDIFSGMTLNSLPLLIIFLVNTVLVGAVYGVSWACVMAVKKWRSLIKEISMLLKQPFIRKLRIVVLSLVVINLLCSLLIKLTFIRIVFVFIAIILFFLFYLWIFTKAIEKCAMIKTLQVSKLTEGDWIAKEIIINKKHVVGPKDLGISKEQIALLKRYKVKQVIVKEGIPFVPSFFVAYLVTLSLGNWLLLVI